MPRTQFAENLRRTVLFTVLVLIFLAYIPYGIVTSNWSTEIAVLGKFRQLGQLLIMVGIVGHQAFKGPNLSATIMTLLMFCSRMTSSPQW